MYNEIIKSAALFALLIAVAAVARAQQPGMDLTARSLEELMNVEVTSVSKREQKLSEAAAAIYVITQEDIRRSGAVNVPELLRLAPGVNVARINASTWAISVRGFNGRFSNKLLVLIDGRSVYLPSFSGVYWQVQDLMVEDIERIEIIRGPGGTLWGANAINGVINIITKHTKETQGGLVAAGSGTEEQGFGSIRLGGALGRQAYYRFYTKYFNRDRLADSSSGLAGNDRWNLLHSGFRIDWKFSDRDSVTGQGDLYRENEGQFLQFIDAANSLNVLPRKRDEMSGGNLLARWNRAHSERSDTTLQFYYDRFALDDGYFNDKLDTFDLDFQNHLALNTRQDLVWGLGYRSTRNEANHTPQSGLSLSPKTRRLQLFSAFAQDELTLVKKQLRLTVGAKLEHNDYTGVEIQPSARLLWTPDSRHTFWGAVSRAVRTPSRKDRDTRFNIALFPGESGLFNMVSLFGNPNFKSETLHAYELGYRGQPGGRFSVDLAAFYNSYNHLTTAEQGAPFFESDPQPPHILIPIRYDNLMSAQTYGVEASAHWRATERWRLSTNYSFLQVRSQLDPSSRDIGYERTDTNSPNHQFHLRSFLNFPRNLELDTSLYSVGRLMNGLVPDYTRVDARIGWRPRENLELSVGAQNLLDNRHPEFDTLNQGIISGEVKRSVYGKLTWRF